MNNIQIYFPDVKNFDEIIKILEIAKSQNNILWSEKIHQIATKELNQIISKEKTEEEILERSTSIFLNEFLKQNFKTLKLITNFIFDPTLTILLTVLLNKDNYDILMSEDIYEGAVASNFEENNNGKTLFYFLTQKII